jgi:hypothetical protein
MSQYDQLHKLAAEQYNHYRGWDKDDTRGYNHMLPYIDNFYEALALHTASEQLHKAEEKED